MTMLLKWSLRFVEDFTDDIIAAFDQYMKLSRRARDAHLRGTSLPGKRRRPQGTVRLLVAGLLDDFRARGLSLPGRQHTNRAITISNPIPGEPARRAGHPPCRRHDHGLWPALRGRQLPDHTGPLPPRRLPRLTTRISYEHAPVLARHLSSACLAIIGYLYNRLRGTDTVPTDEHMSVGEGCDVADYLAAECCDVFGVVGEL
ncbi:hypothetical protein [Streptomyces chartreusis]|uniref:Uncharacterized protein n=1 Tax=Streptomyces chartreusis TaxID=1969 RepID=A0A7I0NSV9_STRCX|nr:hypothetical protein [Streptomyces chartreusis]QKZ16152.1 hypothetical protein HUT05_01415 [Streptomyces chartreusis]